MDVRVGVVADTHGLFDPVLVRHLRGVDRIIHAGDIGDVGVIERLRRIAPVTAVSGNVDKGQAGRFPMEAVIELAGYRIAVRHIVYEGGRMRRDARCFLERTRPDICIFGHTHKPSIEQIGRLLLFNPGSAGPRRFRLPRCLGLLSIRNGVPRVEHIRLPQRRTQRIVGSKQVLVHQAVVQSARACRVKAKGGKR